MLLMKESMLNLKEKQYIISIPTFKLPASAQHIL